MVTTTGNGVVPIVSIIVNKSTIPPPHQLQPVPNL